MTEDKPSTPDSAKPFYRCGRFWLRAVPLVLLVVAAVAFIVLRYGNPQWHRWIYMFQAYVYPTHSNGHIRPPANYTGVYRKWHSNGQLAMEAPCSNGRVATAGMKCWYPSGVRHVEITMKDGLEERVEWHPNGRIYRKWTLRGAMMVGPYVTWNRNGTKSQEEFYVDGVQEGPCTVYATDGRVVAKGQYKSGKMTGLWTEWGHRGGIVKTEHYIAGVQNGECKSWDEDGKLLAVGVYKNGRPWSGSFSVWDAKLQKQVTKEYLAGKEQ